MHETLIGMWKRWLGRGCVVTLGVALSIGTIAGCDKGSSGDETEDDSGSSKKKKTKKKDDEDKSPFDLDNLANYTFGGEFDNLDAFGPSFGASEHSEYEPASFSRGWAAREAHDVLKRAMKRKYKVKQLRAGNGAWCLMFHENKMVRRLMTHLGGPTEEFAYSKRGRLIHWYHNDRKKPAKHEWAYFHGGANLMAYDSKEGKQKTRSTTPPGGTAEHILEHSWACLSAMGASNPKPGADTAPPPEPAKPPPADPAAPTYEMGQNVNILWGKKWYPGKVLEVAPNGTYKVHYDGYSAAWDEFVSAARLKAR